MTGGEVRPPVRVAVGEDDVLLREGVTRILGGAGFDVVTATGDADDLLRRCLAYRPDVVVVDVQMPPGLTDDGLRAAVELRRRRRQDELKARLRASASEPPAGP